MPMKFNIAYIIIFIRATESSFYWIWRNAMSFWCASQVTNEEQSSISNDNSILQKNLCMNSQNRDPSESCSQAHGSVHADLIERLKHIGRLEGWTEWKGLAELSPQIQTFSQQLLRFTEYSLFAYPRCSAFKDLEHFKDWATSMHIK